MAVRPVAQFRLTYYLTFLERVVLLYQSASLFARFLFFCVARAFVEPAAIVGMGNPRKKCGKKGSNCLKNGDQRPARQSRREGRKRGTNPQSSGAVSPVSLITRHCPFSCVCHVGRMFASVIWPSVRGWQRSGTGAETAHCAGVLHAGHDAFLRLVSYTRDGCLQRSPAQQALPALLHKQQVAACIM